jgi:hypothetical protein
MGQAALSYYHPDRPHFFTKVNQLEFQKDAVGEVASVMVNNPTPNCPPQQLGRVAGSSLLFAFAVLVLLLRAEPAASPETAAKGSGRGAGLSIQAFGLAVLVASLAAGVAGRSTDVNVLGVAVIASGYYLSRGSRLAAKWALAFMALLGATCLFFAAMVAIGADVEGIGPGEAPWAITVGLAGAAWAVVNLFLVDRFLRRTTGSAKPSAAAGRPRD